MRFLQSFLASLLALVVFVGLAFVLLLVFISTATSEPEVVVRDNSVLHLKLDKPITDREFEDDFAELFGESGTIGLIQMKEALDFAKDDDKIKGILIESPWMATGFAIGDELRQSIVDFKESGKFVYSYGDFYTEGGYILASAADSVFMSPEGFMEFNGISAELTFFKGTMDKLGIEPQIFRVGEYKSAVEAFSRKDMSEENEEQLSLLFNEIYDDILERVSDSRGLSTDELRRLSDSMVVRNAGDALENGLIDRLAYYDEVMGRLREDLELDEDDRIPFISYGDYKKTVKSSSRSRDRIAVIVAAGDIMLGGGDNNVVGSEQFAEEIRKARKSSRVKAIVLRVNSPGGNALASDIIWREIEKAKEEKPVVASFSTLAASGGYYIGMGADTIVAQPNTITGSIGIYSILLNMESFLDNKLGVTTDRVNTGEHSDIFTVTRSLTDVEKEIFQNEVNEGYQTFIGKAAQGRGMTVEEIDEVGRGRIWTGTQAKELGLVDVLGDFDDAIEIAAGMAGIEEYRIRLYPVQKTFFEELMTGFGSSAKTRVMKNELGEFYPYVDALKKLKNMQGVQARLPFDFEIK